MSKSIDEKVVEMRFDNSQFEKNVQTSISSLEELKHNLDFSGATKGLDEICSSTEDADGVMSTLTDSVGSVGEKFSAMEIIAITALANITNSVVNQAKRWVTSLSFDQIASGWQKYADKTTAVQTILSATGMSIDEVNEQLDKLNWFTDETSYNFVDMVGNIGKFTSMGIDLDKSVTAMMGIANWAAVSGQGTNEASRAMYNLAQAIGVGAVKLQDWKSIENANMATKEFKDLAIETAKALGTLDKEAKTSGGTLVEAANFSSTLSDGWFTSDVLLATLQKYGEYSEEVYKVVQDEGLTASEAMKKVGDETMQLGSKAFKAAQEAKTFVDAINSVKDAVSTGWMNSFEIIFGNYEEAKVLWTDLANELYDIFASGAEDRNNLLGDWKELGGRTKLIESFFNVLTILKNAIGAVKEAFRDIFPAKTAEQLYGMTEAFYNFTEKLKNNEKSFENMKRILKGFFAILDIGKQLMGAIFRAVSPVFRTITNVGGGVIGLTASFSDLIVRLDETIKRTGIFDKVFQKIASIIITVINAIKRFFNELKQTKLISGFISLLNKAHTALKNFINAIKEKFSSPGFDLFHALLERIRQVLTQIGKILSTLKQAFINVINAIASAISASSILTILSKVWSIIVAIAKVVVNLLGKAISALAEKLKAGDLKGFIDLLTSLSIASAIGGIANTIKTFTNAFSGFKDILDSVSGVLNGVRGCLEAYQNKLKADTLFKIAAAIAILVASIVVLSLVDSNKLAGSIAAIAGLFTALMTAMAILTKISGSMGKAAKTTTMMLGLSLSVLILASALKKLSKIDPAQMIIGLAGIGGLVAMLVAASQVMSKNTKTIMKGAAQLILFSIAIRILASACKALSTLSWDEMGRGLAGVGALMAEVAIFLNIAKFSKRCFSTAAGMVLLATAIRILASSCKVFAKLSWEEIGKGLVAIGALLLELAAFTQIIKPKKMISTGLGMIAIATAIRILASAMHSLAALSWEEIGKGLVAMAGCLAEVVIAMNLLPKGMISKGLGLIAVATALLILAVALNKMGKMSWEAIGKGLVTLGGAMLILAAGLQAMKGTLGGAAALFVAAAALAILAPIIALLGTLSWKTIAKGLLSLAGAIAILGIGAAILQPLIPAMLGLSAAFALAGIGALGVGLGLLMLSAAMTALATAGVAMAASVVASLSVILLGVAQLIPSIATLIAKGIIEFVKTIGEGAPEIITAVQNLLVALLAMIREIAPDLIETIFVLLMCALETLVSFTPKIVQAIFNILISALQVIADNIGLVVQKAIDVVIAFIEGIASKIPDVIQAGFDLIISFINGLADAIDNNTQPLIDAIGRLIKSILNAIVSFFSGGLNILADIGKNLMNGLINGIKSMVNKVKDAVCSVGSKIKNWFCDLFGIHSPSRVFADYGMYMDLGLSEGLEKYAGRVEDSTDIVGDAAINGMTNAINNAYDLIENGDFSEPTIRPVMDLSEIQNGTGQLSRMMSDLDEYGVSGSVNMAQSASKSMGSRNSKDSGSDVAGLAKSIDKLAQNQSATFENTFNITGDNPKEIAEEISRILEKQYQRKATTWE